MEPRSIYNPLNADFILFPRLKAVFIIISMGITITTTSTQIFPVHQYG